MKDKRQLADAKQKVGSPGAIDFLLAYEGYAPPLSAQIPLGYE